VLKVADEHVCGNMQEMDMGNTGLSTLCYLHSYNYYSVLNFSFVGHCKLLFSVCLQFLTDKDLLMLGFRLISLLLLSASSAIDTRPRCFTNLATASSSSGDM